LDPIGFFTYVEPSDQIPTAVGATVLEQWEKPLEARHVRRKNLYFQWVNKTKEAIQAASRIYLDKNCAPKVQVKALLWYQGENDALNLDHKSNAELLAYAKNFSKMLRDFMADIGVEHLPTLLVVIDSPSNKLVALDQIRKSQLSLGSSDVQTELGIKDIHLLDIRPLNLQFAVDQVHLTTNSHIQLGEALYRQYLKMRT
jgi:hypothetical protein